MAMTAQDNGADVAVVIVNYGTADLAIAAARSVLERGHGGRSVEVHLVDNASPGDDAARIVAAFGGDDPVPGVTLHLEAENHGFGRGNNVVLRALAASAHPPRHVMLLNPDAMLENEAIDLLAGFLDTHPEAGAVGAGISLPDGTAATAAFRFPSGLGEFLRGLSFGPVTRLLARHQTWLPPDHPAGPVDWVAGAAVMIRMDVLIALDFFCDAFFLYYEEVDLMRRIRAAGHGIHYLPAARVIHVEGAATGVTGDKKKHVRTRKPGFLYDSWRIYFHRAFGRAGAVGISAMLMLGFALNYVLNTLRGRPPQAPLGFFGDQTRRVLVPLLTGKAPSA